MFPFKGLKVLKVLRFQGKIIKKLLSMVFIFLENHGIIYLQTLPRWVCKKSIN